MKIVFACGGTGGHIFPAFSLAEELKRRDPATQIIYVCGKKDIEAAIFKMVSDGTIISIESAPFQGGSALFKPSFYFKLFSGFSQAFSLLKKERPDLVMGFGGYFSFPVVLMAKLLGIPALLHEQNVIPGMANKCLCRLADGVALSYVETKAYLPSLKKISVTGNPIRTSIEMDCRAEALSFFKFSRDKITLLVLGGSQGAESINTIFFEALNHVSVNFIKKVQVLHLCGRLDPRVAQSTGNAKGITVQAYSFFERMDLAYGVTDFSLGRAGATFLAEIEVKKIPAILIPYPFGDGHQFLNAEVFAKHHDAVVAKQKELTPQRLAVFLEEMLNNVEFKKNNGNKMNGYHAPEKMSARQLLANFIAEFKS